MPTDQSLQWTFDTKAAIYECIRPGYEKELYQDLFQYIPITPSSNVVEIGIGTGQATKPFLQTGCQLCAVEYGKAMANQCKQRFRAYPNFSVIHAPFEETIWTQNTYDLVYSATAFHWIKETIGYPKVYDMLKGGGVFARFANHPYVEKKNKPLHDAIQALYRIYMPDSKEPLEYTEDDASAIAQIAAHYGFTDIVYHLYHRTRTFSAKEYTALLSTYSDHIAIEETRRNEFFSQIEASIEAYGGTITIEDTIDLELARKP